jgi:hypothetical protein
MLILYNTISTEEFLFKVLQGSTEHMLGLKRAFMEKILS